MQQESSLNEALTSSHAGVSVTEYEASRALDPRQGASWAIWGTTTDDLSIFDDGAAVSPRLRKDVVLIGANFGLGGDVGDFKPFQNFHARTSGGDTKLRNGITGTALQGAFLTDLVKDYPTKYADRLAAEIKAGILDPEEFIVAGFRAEQAALGLGPETLYIPMGRRTRELWDLLVHISVIPREQRVFHREYTNGSHLSSTGVLNLSHYSGAVNMVRAVEALLAQRAAS